MANICAILRIEENNYLRSYCSDDSYDLSENDNNTVVSFSHSYRYSANLSNIDHTMSFDNAQSYLKMVIKHKLKISDLK